MQKKRILIADDEKDMINSLELIIERIGCDPISVDNGEKALEILTENQLNNNPIDLLLCDIHMPGMTGDELLENINQRKISTPAFVISGYGNKDLLVQLMKKGCRDFIDKPFTPEVLEKRINYLLETIDSENAEREKLEFLAEIGNTAQSAVHDINNALAVTLGYADLIQNENYDTDEFHNFVSKIYSSANLASNISEYWLERKSNKITSNNTNMDLNVFINNIATLFKEILPKNIIINTSFMQCPIWFCIDESKLQKIILNLGFNAADAMPDGGTIDLNICLSDGISESNDLTFFLEKKKYILIKISDTGTGISPDILTHIFDDGYSTKKNGHGYGLNNVLHLVNNLDGQITVESIPGQGTCFRLLLPFGEIWEEYFDNMQN